MEHAETAFKAAVLTAFVIGIPRAFLAWRLKDDLDDARAEAKRLLARATRAEEKIDKLRIALMDVFHKAKRAVDQL